MTDKLNGENVVESFTKLNESFFKPAGAKKVAAWYIETSEKFATQLHAPSHEALTHRHLCTQCGAVITLDESRNCQTEEDYINGLCEACALAQPGSEEIV